MELRALLPDDLADETEIVTISVDDSEGMQLMIDRVAADDGVEPDFIMLSDPDHRVIDRYGLFNPDAPPNRPLPHPATYVIDKEGVVRYRFVEVDYRVRPTNEDILEVLKAL
ncbi:MAG: redoxin domain-containing protein [Gemmatimonadetes bacterium]|nr:redoxin domain-containing protein [Gemmatimonadota bacterium]MYB08209.1 redoxin domain-containing protein [Gemmatimonadota bacterium]MYE14943.1 redoxin domain-containing protein [Gemmatimonadota bacterium]MYG24059.1 redoxin domain-containing protein [Gemmatimonadota bacterium]MYJ38972.1 redoxin domain-containing protein [Gemmatimonadota bacterium]